MSRETAYISIHAPRGGSDRGKYRRGNPAHISIHAPRGGSDVTGEENIQDRMISIHAPRGGSDLFAAFGGDDLTDFNPRSPWGERRVYQAEIMATPAFQSTLPVGGATLIVPAKNNTVKISIHAPRGGSDVGVYIHLVHQRDFNPRSPWGERLLCQCWHQTSSGFQSTLPVGGATGKVSLVLCDDEDFNPRSPWGERRRRQ